MIEITEVCTQCGQKNKLSVYTGINTLRNPELKSKVKDGSLFLWDCPHCGNLNLLSYNVLYHDPKFPLMIWLLPNEGLNESDKENVEKKIAEISKQIHEDLSFYTLRRVDDVGSLIEKANIFDCGLDDTVIEMCKYVTKLELVEKITDPEQVQALMQKTLRFYKLEGADNEILLTLPEDGQMKTLSLGFHIYEDCRNILKRNTAVKPAPGFGIVDEEWLTSFFH